MLNESNYLQPTHIVKALDNYKFVEEFRNQVKSSKKYNANGDNPIAIKDGDYIQIFEIDSWSSLYIIEALISNLGGNIVRKNHAKSNAKRT